MAGYGVAERRCRMDKERLEYNDKISAMRQHEYPMLEGAIYLDHAGTALHAKSLVEAFAADMMSSLIGNPHSASPSSTNVANRIDNTRLRVLELFNASPNSFDVVFVANATAGVKLVVEAFRDHEDGFWYGYHKDSHTSLVGPRKVAIAGHHCFPSDMAVEEWIEGGATCRAVTGLFAYPAQSNMNGRRLPLSWSGEVRRKNPGRMYTLLDAAGFVSTSPLDLSDASNAPDFTVLSFYKIFGFPDLGALIVRKESGHVFDSRRYFGGGTVELVATLGDSWHERKESSLHARLEDGTLAMRSIMALDCAIKVHTKLYGSLRQISLHTSFLSRILYDRLSSLKHGNGSPVCRMYQDSASVYGDPRTQGATVAFNLLDSAGNWRSNYEVNKLAAIKQIHIRTGTLCNPGGTADALGVTSNELKGLFAAGFRCGNENDLRGGKPVGMIRASLGASSTLEDIEKFVAFIKEFFVEDGFEVPRQEPRKARSEQFAVESLTIYPIKSCAAWQIPPEVPWTVRSEGLAWDREWCLIHQGTRASLNQKHCPRMVLLKPSIDLSSGILRVKCSDPIQDYVPSEIEIPLHHNHELFVSNTDGSDCPTSVCGDKVQPRVYASPEISEFFSTHLQVPCHLAWLPTNMSTPHRVVKARSQLRTREPQISPVSSKTASIPGAFPTPPPSPQPRPLLLANESPILTIFRPSLDQLNRQIVNASEPGVLAPQIGPETFRANILLKALSERGDHQAFAEDYWRSMTIFSRRPAAQSTKDAEKNDSSDTDSKTDFRVFGPCRRCQMICVNQQTGERGQEPFVTLAKTRSRDGGVWFGIHCGLDSAGQETSIRVGDLVEGFT